MNLQQKLRLFQVLGELAIPLLGYFWWGWSYFDLCLFYLLDLLATSFFLYLKMLRIQTEQRLVAVSLLPFSVKLFSAVAVLVALGYLLMTQLIPNFNFWEATWHFLLLEDLGLPQGIFLFPLVIYAAYLQHKMNFLQPQRYRTMRLERLQADFLRALYICIAGLGLGFALSFLLPIPELLAVLFTALGIAIYSFFYRNL